MVFSANSRNSAGTSSFGSIMPSSSGLNGALPHFQNGVFALFARRFWYYRPLSGNSASGNSALFVGMYPDLRRGLPLASPARVPELDQSRDPAFQSARIIARQIGSAFR